MTVKATVKAVKATAKAAKSTRTTKAYRIASKKDFNDNLLYEEVVY